MTTQETELFPYDSSAPLDIQEKDLKTRDGVAIRDISFAAAGGERVSAFLVVPPEGATPYPHPAILWVHWLEPREENSNRTQFLDEAILLAQQGVVSILPDAFWSTTPAESEGRKQWGWRTDFAHDHRVVTQQVVELRRALDVLLAQPGIDLSRTAYVGHDFGAMVGALVAAADRRVQSYVLAAGTYSFGQWFVFGSGLTPEAAAAYQEQIAMLDPARFISKAAHARLYFQFATQDFYVPEEAARRLYDAASKPKRISWYDADHDLEDAKGASRVDRLAWLRQELKLPSLSI